VWGCLVGVYCGVDVCRVGLTWVCGVRTFWLGLVGELVCFGATLAFSGHKVRMCGGVMGGRGVPA
jgi:hypothetical protein